MPLRDLALGDAARICPFRRLWVQPLAHALTGVTLRAGLPTVVTLRLALLGDVDLEQDHADLVVPTDTVAALVRLGWTPPTAAATATSDATSPDPT